MNGVKYYRFGMKKNLLFATFILIAGWAQGQKLTTANLNLLKQKEDSLAHFSHLMINAEEAHDRFRADSNFVRILVRALQIPHSIDYPFQKIETVSQLYPSDSSFRIFTWQLKKDEYVYLQKGAIQVRTDDGKLKLFPLFDVSMFTSKPEDSVRNHLNWIGAIYYRIIQTSHNGKNYYTLLGFDDFSISSNKKWMEVLTFNERGEPQFGGNFIRIDNDSTGKKIYHRFHIEYKKDAGTFFNFDPELNMIVYDHLISESDEPERKQTYVPDGSYDGFKWQNGQWVHVEKIFNYNLEDGQFPHDARLRDDKGNINEALLEDASRRNLEKADSLKKKKDN